MSAINPVYICTASSAAETYKQTVTYTAIMRDDEGNAVRDANGNLVYETKTDTVDVKPTLAEWGVAVCDYTMVVTVNGTEQTKQVDFQDLLINISEQRAATVEKQIEPMSTRMSTRNRKLDNLGAALAIVADIQSKFTDADETGDKASTAKLSDEAKAGLLLVGCTKKANDDGTLTLNKAQAEYYQQLLKTELDSLNNASSKDMTRLQSLVDKRDESYSTATSLMQAVADTRANTIKNM